MRHLHQFREIVHKTILAQSAPSVLDSAALALLEGRPIDFEHLPKFVADNLSSVSAPPLEYMDAWRDILAVSLLLVLQEGNDPHRRATQDQLRQTIGQLDRHPLWKECQLATALRSLTRCLVGLPTDPVIPKQFASGAAPLEWGGHWPWAAVPHQRFHAETGLLWNILGQLTQNKRLSSAAESLAEWHLTTLDGTFFPCVGLFCQESDAAIGTLLVYNTLLFYSVASTAQRGDFEEVAQTQIKHLQRVCEDSSTSLLASTVILMFWIEHFGAAPAAGPWVLSDRVVDRDIALVGYRSEAHDVRCTLTGGSTGLGCYRLGGVQVISYGPQLLPLGDCSGFGIEADDFDARNGGIVLDVSGQAFALEGKVRLASPPRYPTSRALFRNGGYSGVWLDVCQRYATGQLGVDVSFASLRPLKEVAFSFFVKAEGCIPRGVRRINPRTLDRYQGALEKVVFEGFEGALSIEARQSCGEMIIVPLAGGDNFWGADFLLAYLLDPSVTTYGWTIGPRG